MSNNENIKIRSSLPLVSIIMSVYNEPKEWINNAIESILNQTYKNFEFIIVNDNPDSTEKSTILESFIIKDSRIKLIKNEKNIGLTKSLNIALRYCSGKYVARMDADDISTPKRLEKQVDMMESNSDIIVCGTNIKLFGSFMPFYVKKIFENDKDIRGQMFLNSGFAHPTVLIRKSVLDENGICYDENFRSAQDYKLWYDLRNYGKYANLKEKLLKYRLSKHQVTSNLSNDQQNNRKLLSSLFKQEYSASDKTQSAYYARSEAYDSPTPIRLLNTCFSLHINVSIKERISLVVKALLLLIKRK